MATMKLRIEIDQYHLDKEWINQPTQFLYFANKLADVRAELDREKAALDVIKADLDRKIREYPDEYGLTKVTETAVANAVLLQDEYTTQLATINDVKHEQMMTQAAVEALDQRKRALENLVQLHGMSYFAELKEPKGQEEEIREAEKRNIRSRGRRDKNIDE